MFCPSCGKEVQAGAAFCFSCGTQISSPAAMPQQYPPPQGMMPQPGISRKNEGVAAVLSVLFPGLGQVYNGEIAKGIAFVVIGIILFLTIFILVGLVLYPIFWIYNIYDAYDTAKKIDTGLVRV